MQRGTDPLFSDPRTLLGGVGAADRSWFAVHLCIGLAGLLCTQHFNRAHDAAKDGGYMSALFASGASASFTLDALLVAVSLLVWLARDAHGLGFSVVSIVLLVLFSGAFAIAYCGTYSYRPAGVLRISDNPGCEAARWQQQRQQRERRELGHARYYYGGGQLEFLPWCARAL